MGTHDDADGLDEREQSGVDEGDGHQCSGSRTLHGCGYKHTGEHTGETVGGHSTKDVSQLRTRHLLQGFAHRLHTEHQQRERT